MFQTRKVAMITSTMQSAILSNICIPLKGNSNQPNRKGGRNEKAGIDENKPGL